MFAEYITKDGEQEYENLGWMNGHEVIYTIPAGVEVISLAYHETGYNCSFAGSFECDNSDLNSLWKKSQRTLYITMRDNYMDCPDRESTMDWRRVKRDGRSVLFPFAERKPIDTQMCTRICRLATL